jgi:diguanylate cyclase (GGDEF)-like protein/PAS domain S-box-containing protein
MLDAPILVHGRVAGVLCLEHVGEPRRWEPAEEVVVATFADFVGMALGTAAHIEQARELAKLQSGLEQLVEQRTRELRSSQATVRRLFETSPVGLVVTRFEDQAVLLMNRRASEMLEVPMDDAAGRRGPDFWVDREAREALLTKVRANGTHEGAEAELQTARGRRFWAIVSASKLDFEGVPATVVSIHDVSAQRAARDSLRTLLEAAPIPLVVTRLEDGNVRFANSRAADIFRTTVDEMVGKHEPDFYATPEERSAFVEALRRDGRIDGFAARLKAADETTFWSLLSARTLELEGDEVIMLGFADLTEQKEIERRLRDLAELDGLTGAFNRRHFFDVGGAALVRTASRDRPSCVAMIDADHFKNVNDRYGHAVGDDALRLLTSVCRNECRASDILARYGGEELVVLLTEADAEAAVRVAERIRAGLRTTAMPVPGGGTLQLTISVGIAQHREGETLEALLRRADEALYDAKRSGRDRVAVAP